MARAPDVPAERIALLTLLSTLLFVGALRAFLSSVYYQNLTDLGLNITAAWSLLLLAPLLFLVPPLARRPRALLVAGALGLALGRALLAPTRGTPLHLPLAGVAAASALVLLGALLPLARRQASAIGVGLALGWALDVALLWYGDSADLTAQPRGLAFLLPAGAFVVWLALDLARRAPESEPEHVHVPSTWLAGAAFGAWIFVENTIFANAYGAARWNGVEPAAVAGASVAGLAIGALLLTRGPLPRWALLTLHIGLALALLDHALLHTRAFPLLVLVAQATLAVDAALLAQRLTGRSLALAALVTLALHFAFAFTYLFAYVPMRAAWEGRAPLLILLAGALLVATVARRPPAPPARLPRRAVLLAAPLLLALAAAATPGAEVVEPEGAEVVRVLSFNVHQGFANDGVLDPRVFIDVLREEDPDIVVLQESDTPRFTSGNLDVATYLAQQTGYHLVYGQPTREQAFGGALLSRFPVREVHVHPLPSGSDDRSFTEARVDVGGRDVWIYAVHLTLPREDRLAQVDALLAQAATRSGPMILAGDFNSCPTGLCPDEENKGDEPDDVYARITARYQDPWVTLGQQANDSAAYTYEATAPDQRIDYVFVSEGIVPVSYAAVRTPAALAASDHLPVRADLRLA